MTCAPYLRHLAPVLNLWPNAHRSRTTPMDATSNLNLPFILAAQAQKHVTHNNLLRRCASATISLRYLHYFLSSAAKSISFRQEERDNTAFPPNSLIQLLFPLLENHFRTPNRPIIVLEWCNNVIARTSQRHN